MTTILLATGTVHEAAALCDYLGDRLDAGDTVHAVGVDVDSNDCGDADRGTASVSQATQGDDGVPSGRATSPRDRADALNAVRARLGAVATVDTADADAADPAALLGERARSIDADEIVIGNEALARQLLGDVECPLVVVTAPQS